ncbi:MAG: hypothetical protein KGD68_11140 [Candidatus Lokiarchaeota archaeon]|nr:hypothetical protein [Candidatus Lokiarchaeota archaeon]
MDLDSKYTEIKRFLLLPDEAFNLEQLLNKYYNKEADRLEILGSIIYFIQNFSIFKTIKPFMKSVYFCIENTVDMEIESLSDFKELLIKNALMRFVQEYIDYAQLTQKRQVLKLLSDSLDKLQIQPIIINLGLLLKPMYQDQDYLDRIELKKAEEITYLLSEEIEIKIKAKIDNWLKTQIIKLDNQNILSRELLHKYDLLAKEYHLIENSETYQNLSIEVMEMLTMRLTMLSLMEAVSNESFEPIPIK